MYAMTLMLLSANTNHMLYTIYIMRNIMFPGKWFFVFIGMGFYYFDIIFFSGYIVFAWGVHFVVSLFTI